MRRKITSNFVNWVDGMKLSKDQFITQERAIRDHLRDAVELGLSDHHFGLLEPVDLSFHGREARLIACRAVCRDGSRIEHLSEHEQAADADLSTYQNPEHEGRSFYLLAMPQHEASEGLGPYVGEPPRQETCVPRMKLLVMPDDRLNATALRSAMLPIARFSVQQGKVVPASDYLAPWFQITGCPDLEKLKQDLEETLNVVSGGSKMVLNKLYDKPREIQDRFPNRNYEHWAIHTLNSISRLKADLQLGMERPYQLVRAVMELANAIEGAWASMPEREEFMKQMEGIGNWSRLVRGMQMAMSKLASFRYTHWDLNPACELCATFLEQARLVHAQLGELNRFEPVTLLRDVPQATQQEVIKPVKPEPEPGQFKWNQTKP
jgi:hypothetical protein